MRPPVSLNKTHCHAGNFASHVVCRMDRTSLIWPARGRIRASSFFVMPGSSRTIRFSRSTWFHHKPRISSRQPFQCWIRIPSLTAYQAEISTLATPGEDAGAVERSPASSGIDGFRDVTKSPVDRRRRPVPLSVIGKINDVAQLASTGAARADPPRLNESSMVEFVS